MRILRLAAVLAFLALVLPAASGAGNRATFSDPVGDNEGGPGFASDITSVEVTSTDDGGVTFKISLSDPGGRFYDGDFLAVAINSDGNATNGFRGTGNDTYLEESVSSSGQPIFRICNYFEREECSSFNENEASDVATGPNSHVVTFNIEQGSWSVISFYVFEIYEAPSGNLYVDRTAIFRFDVNADPDRDGYIGSADDCPTINGGNADRDPRDGCPDRLPTPSFRYQVSSQSSSQVVLRSFATTNAPAGTRVTVRLAGRAFHRRGNGPIRGLAFRAIRVGSIVTVIYSHPTREGAFQTVRWTASGPRKVKAGCTPRNSARMLTRCPPK